MRAAKLKYEDLHEGDVYSFTRTISEEDVQNFVAVTNDFNPLHVDEKFGKSSKFGKNIVHGMLAASLFSTLVGMHCPGEKCLYLAQTLNFRSPIYYGDTVTVRGTVIGKNDAIQMLILKTEVIVDGMVAINGEAKVRFQE